MNEEGSDELVARVLELYQDNRLRDALQLCRKVTRQDPGRPESYYILGCLECVRGRWRAALRWFSRAILLRPAEARYRAGSAVALWKSGQARKAVEETERALRYAPDDVDLRVHHLKFLIEAREPDGILEALNRVLAALPDRADLVRRSAEVLERCGRFWASEQCWRKLLEISPENPQATLGLAGTLNRQGRVDEALGYFRTAAHMPVVGDIAAQSLLLSSHYSEREEPAQIFREHRIWGEGVVERPAFSTRPTLPPLRRLRIGYVSGDFRRHAVAHFFEPLLTHHDKSKFEVHCFSNVRDADDMTTRLRTLASGWHEISALSDDEAAHVVRKARIDVLVDLNGHTAHNRLAVFACKPAPIQVTYLGYPDTTGLRTIDFRLTDSIVDPPGMTENLHSEELVRLDPCFLCYRPWLAKSPVGLPPFEAQGLVTFASLAIREKLSPTVLEAWAEILLRVRGARMLIKCRANADPEVRKQLRAFFECRGVSRRRLILADSVHAAGLHLSWYRHVDVMLDTYPYNGTTMTCESLWMGTPVVTLCGRTHVSRVGASVLSQVSLQNLVGFSPQEYIERAVEMGHAKPLLAELRRTLRRRMLRSPIMDGQRLAKSVEAAYREMWRS